ncbi:MAG: phenylalanine--tRNA ligase subunit beta, partial [Candidatus Omnitrophica bacterium]|nr:phenylalanine--tRNA ligase subunit beta [Candidatus Omnitrophota bacterium]
AKDDLIIADLSGPIAIGGVMGGKDSEVNKRTKNILLESAFFSPVSIRRTSRRLGLSSESSYRFERRVDPKGVDQARERAIHLILKYTHAKRVSSVFRSGKLPIREAKIVLNLADVKRILGVQIPGSKIKSYLSRLGLQVSGKGKTIRVQAPSFRADLTQPIDLIEEIARIYGYENIPETLPLVRPIEPRIDPILALECEVRSLCVGLGFSEAITFSLVESSFYDRLGLFKENRVKLINPKNKELNLMRPSLLSGLAQSVRRNLFVGQTDIRLFEIGNRYLKQTVPGTAVKMGTDYNLSPFSAARNVPGTDLPKEERMLAFILSGEGSLGWLEKKRPISFYDLKGAVEEILARFGMRSVEAVDQDTIYQTGEGVQLSVKGKAIGSYGTLSERVRKLFDLSQPVFYAELSLEVLLSLAGESRVVKEIPKFPISPRDLTLIMDERVKAESVVGEIRKMAGELVAHIEVFDYFKGGQIPKGKKSLSFRIHYQAKDRTLQNEEVNKLHFSVIDELNRSFGAELPKGKVRR